MWKLKIKSMIENESNYTFPEFILAIRLCIGTSRKVACADLGITKNRLLSLENGKFSLFPKEIPSIATYYEIPLSLMARKVKLFLREKKIKIHRLEIPRPLEDHEEEDEVYSLR